MLRYVTRRIKDSVERTYNVLEARRTWTYGNEGIFDGNQQQPPSTAHFQLHLDKRPLNSLFEFGFGPKTPDAETPKPIVVKEKIRRRNVCAFKRKYAEARSQDKDYSGSSSSDGDDFRERIHHKFHHCKFQRNFLDALTWSSALICGWYTSQILCMQRRHLKMGRNGSCKYSKMLMQPSQTFHSMVLSHCAQAAPEPPRETFAWKLSENLSEFSEEHFEPEKLIFNVSNEQVRTDNEITVEKKIKPKSVEDAVQNLLDVLGDIEFQLGVESFQSERYDLAFSHFKLATSHNHACATFNLGICYEEGIGVEKNLKKAFDCYMVASSMGHAKALYNVGVFHAQGLANLPKNRKAARQYFKEAAKLGLNEANEVLGIKLEPSKVTPPARRYDVEDIMIAPNRLMFQTQGPVAIAVS